MDDESGNSMEPMEEVPLIHNAFYKVVYNFCSASGFLWLVPVDGSIDYTYHNEKNGHYILLDHIIASPCLVASNKAVSVQCHQKGGKRRGEADCGNGVRAGERRAERLQTG